MAQAITDPKIDGTTPGPLDPDPVSAPWGIDTKGLGKVDMTDPAARLDAAYSKAGITDSGRGSGFADRAYWLEHPSEILNGRLEADLDGTGSDQPTGTPGRGPWLNSGRNAPEAGIGQSTRDAFGGFWDPSALLGGANPTPGAPVGPTTGASDPNSSANRDMLLALLAKLIGPPAAKPVAPVPPITGGGGSGGNEPADPTGAKP